MEAACVRWGGGGGGGKYGRGGSPTSIGGVWGLPWENVDLAVLERTQHIGGLKRDKGKNF